MDGSMTTALRRVSLAAALGLALAGFDDQPAEAQTYGFAAMQAGTINHTTSSAISSGRARRPMGCCEASKLRRVSSRCDSIGVST